MAVVRWGLLLLVTLLAARTMWTHWGPDAHEPHGAKRANRYHCPMHPEILSPDPGECPICHMDLELIPADRLDQTAGATPLGAEHPADVTAVTLSVEKQRSVGLVTSAAETASLGDRLRVPGLVSIPETGLSQVRARAPGFVEEVLVKQTGVRVTRGQVLAKVYSPDIYRAQEEWLAATRWNAQAFAATTPGGSGAPDLASAARRGLELLGMTAADIDEVAREGHALRTVPVRAPAAGVVTTFNAVLGSRADPEVVLYEIADLSKVWVVASVHERDATALRVGAPARFTASGATDAALQGRIDLIEPLLDEATRTSRLRVLLDNRSGALRPGQFGEVELELPASEGLFVPRDAVIRTGKHDYVYVALGEERFEPRSVVTGLARDERIQVIRGVAAGERVVTRGSFMLDSESRLQASLGASTDAK